MPPASLEDEVKEEKRELFESAESAQEGGVVHGVEPVDASHNHTTNKSVAMEMTLEPSSTKYDDEPYVEQVRHSSTVKPVCSGHPWGPD